MTDTHREAIEAAARVLAVMQCCGPEGCLCFEEGMPDECPALDNSFDASDALAAIRAFLAKVHENTDPDETARYCMLAQMREEIG